MNKQLVGMCFIMLILSGFMFSYTLWVTGKIVQSIILIIAYYLSLIFILIQFIEKPKATADNNDKHNEKRKLCEL